MTDFNNNASLKAEHDLRAKINQVRAHVEAATGALYVTVFYEQGNDTGKWRINSWGNGTVDISTKGTQLDVVMAEHIRRVGVEKGMDTLPAMIGHSTAESET